MRISTPSFRQAKTFLDLCTYVMQNLSRDRHQDGQSQSNQLLEYSSAEGDPQTLRQACYRENPESAMCVQNLNDSRGLAIRITYRISLRSSSLWEPRHPPLKVVSHQVFVQGTRCKAPDQLHFSFRSFGYSQFPYRMGCFLTNGTKAVSLHKEDSLRRLKAINSKFGLAYIVPR